MRVYGAAFVAAVTLVACGGGSQPPVQATGGGNATPAPTASPTASPTPSPAASPELVTFTGTVMQLSGSLAHGSAVPASPMPTPVPGAPIAGANVYVTTATGIFTNGTPSPILAQATTAPDGTFTTPSLSVSAFNGRNAGIVVLNGSTVSPANGLTDKGFAVLHTQVAVNAGGSIAVPNLEIDTLSPDEASGAPEIESLRASRGFPATAVDEAELEAVRWSVQNDTGAGTSQCGITMGPLRAIYDALGGQAALTAAGNSTDATLSAAIDTMYQNPVSSEVWAAAAGPANNADCGSSPNPNGTSFYQILTVNSSTVF